MIKLWPLSGGIHPPQNKYPSCTLPIGQAPLPERFYLSLFQDRGTQLGAPLIPVVAAGEQVKKGQLIARGGTIECVPLHAPTSGIIGQIVQRPLNHPSGNLGDHLELISDGADQWCVRQEVAEPFLLDKNTLLELINNAGICGMGGAGFPTAAKLSTHNPIHTLILNGTECEPYITADDRLMQEAASDILLGAQLCSYLLGANKLLIAIEDNKPQAITAVRQALEESPKLEFSLNQQLAILPTIYPSGGTKQLVQMLTGQQVPSGQQAASLGIMVMNVATARAVWRAVRWGEPLIERVTTFTGQALKQPHNMWVRIGASADHYLTHAIWQGGHQLILGGPFMGFNIEPTASLGKTSNCVIAPSAEEMPAPPPEAPCIRCGLCDGVCPAQLLPQQLLWYAKSQETERLITHNLFDCIECGACSYVCPSTIPLVHYYRHAKAQINYQRGEKLKADQARLRFDNHQKRLAELEAQKDAKRQARIQAGALVLEQIQQQQAAAQTQLQNTTQAATENNATSEELVAKLRRHQLSAQDRLQRLITQAQHEQDPARKEKFAASIKQAQQRLSEAENKLAELKQPGEPEQPQYGQIAVAKLFASPQQISLHGLTTLEKQLAITEEKLRQAHQAQSPSLNALTLAVEKLKQKIQLAQEESTAACDQPTQPDAATLAAAQQVLARLAAKKTQTAEDKQQALRESLEKKIEQLHARIAVAEAEKLPILKASLATLEQKLRDLQP